MKSKPIKSIVIIGSGNVATSLAINLFRNKYSIRQIYSATLEHAEELAIKVNASYTNIPQEIDCSADLYIIATPDNIIEEILESIIFSVSIIVHTSGATSINVFLNKNIDNYGVLYPLQTFSKSKPINDFKNVPVFLEANKPDVLKVLYELAVNLSDSVYEVNSEQRLALHVSGVFACNFVNHLLALSVDIMTAYKLDKQWLTPLINETIEKAISVNQPGEVQTGPAIRNDKLTLQRHTDFLKDNPNWLEIYKLLSDSIMNYKEK
mgnify:CR=1 FL=1